MSNLTGGMPHTSHILYQANESSVQASHSHDNRAVVFAVSLDPDSENGSENGVRCKAPKTFWNAKLLMFLFCSEMPQRLQLQRNRGEAALGKLDSALQERWRGAAELVCHFL